MVGQRDKEVINGKTLIIAIDLTFPVQFCNPMTTLCKTRKKSIGTMKPHKINSTLCLDDLEIRCKCFVFFFLNLIEVVVA